MSRTIDSRVVEMQFDNKQFESNVKTSMSTLDKLKQSLNLTGVSKGLDSVSAAAKNVDLSGLSGAVEKVSLKFSALQVIAVTALSNITTSVMRAGSSLLKNAIGAIAEGGKKRALNIEQAKFQFKGLGMDVEATMADASYAVDGTAYSLDAAAKVASQLGASGMRAGDDMRKSLRAVSGVAAMAGSSYEDIGNVFTKVAGQGRLMGDDLLRLSSRGINAAATIAKELNITEAEVRDMVTKGKVNFQMFADAMDSAFGEHATAANETFTGSLSNVKAALARIGENIYGPLHKNMIGPLNELRLRINEVAKILEPAFAKLAILMEKAGKKATEMLKKLDLTEMINKIKMGDKTSDKLRRTFAGLFAVVDLVAQAMGFVLKVAGELFGLFGGPAAGGILAVTAYFGDWLVKLNEFIKKTNIFNKGAQGFTDFINAARTAVVDFIKVLADKFDFHGLELLHSFLERVHERLSGVGEAAGNMGSGVVTALDLMGEAVANSKFLTALELMWKGVTTVVGGIAKLIGELTGGLVTKIGDADFSGIFDLINTITFSGIAIGISKFIKHINELKNPLSGIMGILDGVRGCLTAYQDQLKAKTLITIATAIAILAASILVISLIDSKKLTASLGAISVLLTNLMVSMSLFSKIGKVKGVATSVTAMISMSIAIYIMASALKKIGDLNFKELAVGLAGVVGLTGTMVAAAKIMSSGSGAMVKGSAQMVIFALAIKVLASACEDLAKLKWNELAKGLIGVGVLMASVSIFLNTAKFSGKSILTAVGIVILASAIKILASACEDFAKIKWEGLAKGLSAISVLLAQITIFTKLTGNAKSVISTGIALIAIAAAMKIFASAIQDMGSMKWEEIARGLAAMAGTLLAVTIAVKLMPKNIIRVGIGLVIVSSALLILANVLTKLGGMKWDEIARGLTVFGGSIVILAIGLRAMTGTIAGSAAMLVAASALVVLTPVLSILGAMSWTSIAKGLVTLAGAFTIIGIAGLVLTPILPAILGLGGAFALIGIGVLGIGVGLLAAGAGLSAVAVGFTALAAAGTAGATAVVAALTVIITGVASLIPAVAKKIGEGIVAFCGVIAESAPAMGEAFKTLLLTGLDVMVETVPAIAHGLLELIAGVLEALVEYTPRIVDSIYKFLIGVLESIARNLPGLIKAGVDVLMAFFAGITDALGGIDTTVLLKGIAGIGLLSAMMLALAAVATLVPAAMIGVLSMGVLIAEIALVLAAVGALSKIPGLTWLIGEGASLIEGIGNAIGAFVGGIVGGFLGGVTSQFPQMGTDLSLFMTNVTPFIEGAKNINASAMEGIKALAETILILTAANILDGLTSWFTGGTSLTKFGKELAAFGPHFKVYYDSIKGVDGSVVQASANAAKTLAEMAGTLPNQGGLVGWFSGENSLSTFADELVIFGPKLKRYADSVKGIDADVVVNSTHAATALAEMANNLPNQGGVVSWFTGDNNLSTFAEELVTFGPVLKRYADSVRGLDPAVIINSASAAKAIAEMSNNLPNQGGAVSWFTGDDTLSMFGYELSAFGPHLKRYSDSISGLDSSIVINSANAAKALAELANNLPNSGGMASWFTGNNDIGTFGKNLVGFGRSFALYYESVSAINTSTLSLVLTEFKKLVDIAKGIQKIDTSNMSTFSKDFTTLGKNGVNGFIGAFTNSDSKVRNAATSMLTTFIDSANTKKTAVTSTFVNIVQSIVPAITGKQTVFATLGMDVMSGFISGLKRNESSVKQAFASGLTDAVNIIRGCYNQFYLAGAFLVDGFVAGINANIYKVSAKSKQMAKAASTAAKKELDERSPSKVGYEIGDYFGVAFVNAIDDWATKAYTAGEGMARAAKTGLSSAVSKITDIINGDIDTQPTIRPVLDLTNIQNGANSINSLFGQRALSLANSTEVIPERLSMLDAMNDTMKLAVDKVLGVDDNKSEQIYYFEIPVMLDGRETARATAVYTKQELSRLNTTQSRIRGEL